MDLFIGFKRFLQIIGFSYFDHPCKKFISIFINIICFCVLTFASLSTLWFFFFEADTFLEETLSIFTTISIFPVIIEYCVLLWRRQQVLDSIEQFELKIRERMSLAKKYPSNHMSKMNQREVGFLSNVFRLGLLLLLYTNE